METIPNTNQDLLGMQRFALTESAYDLVTSLTGIYSRLHFQESSETAPDDEAMARWKERAHQLRVLYYDGDWTDLNALERLIADLSTEYKQAAVEEAARKSRSHHASHPQPEKVFTT